MDDVPHVLSRETIEHTATTQRVISDSIPTQSDCILDNKQRVYFFNFRSKNFCFLTVNTCKPKATVKTQISLNLCFSLSTFSFFASPSLQIFPFSFLQFSFFIYLDFHARIKLSLRLDPYFFRGEVCHFAGPGEVNSVV